MKSKKQKRFSKIPRKIRNLITVKVNEICKEDGIERADRYIVIVDALERTEEIIDYTQAKTNWRQILKKIDAHARYHTDVMNSFFLIPSI